MDCKMWNSLFGGAAATVPCFFLSWLREFDVGETAGSMAQKMGENLVNQGTGHTKKLLKTTCFINLTIGILHFFFFMDVTVSTIMK